MPPLTLRRVPLQARAVATFEQILDSAAILLEEAGFDGFTTNLLSQRSGISTRAIYRYFPNKYALVNELASRMAISWRRELGEENTFADPTTDWKWLWCRYLDKFVAAVHNTRGGVAVLQAMRSHPELRAVDDAANDDYIAEVAKALRTRKPTISTIQAEAIAKTLLKSTVAIVDATLVEDTITSEMLLAMLKTMHIALLEEHLGSHR